MINDQEQNQVDVKDDKERLFSFKDIENQSNLKQKQDIENENPESGIMGE